MKRSFLISIFFVLASISFGQTEYDIIISNGKIIDGTGNSWFYGDIGIRGGKIVSIGRLEGQRAVKNINARGLIVAPGFIDVHAHIESGIFERPTAENFIHDGVTTVVTGNCGGSAVDIKDFFRRIDSMRSSINIATLIGHNTVRRSAMGLDEKFATPEEQSKMEALVEQAMKDGAVGLSTGLIYLPGMYSNTEEVIGLAKVAARMNGIYASHIRNEENKVVDAINEAINIGRSANIPVQVSHFKVSGPANWGRSRETLQLIDQARKEGYDVTIDQYPYTASSTNLGIRLPDWAMSGGNDSLKKRIADPEQHKKIISDMLAMQKRYKYKDYSFAYVAMHTADTAFNGKNISEINKLKGRRSKMKEEAETILDMMVAGGAQMVYHSMNEDDVIHFMKYPFNMFGADAGVSNGKGMPHPRGYGTNARVLGRYVREKKVITLEEAIRRMTSLPAQKFQLRGRGLLLEGMAADIVIFDANEVIDKATFDNPHQFSAGFKHVIVNGMMVIEDGRHNGTRSGMALKGHAFTE